MSNTPNQWKNNALQPKDLFNVPWVVLALVVLMSIIHLSLWLLGDSWQTWAWGVFAFIPERLGGGRVIPRIPGSEVWSFVTYALLHADKYHLLSNSLWLLVFSTPLARRLGAWRYIVVMVAAAVVGASAMLVNHWEALARASRLRVS